MLKVVTSKEMQEIDKRTMEDYGISSTILMEMAGLSVAKRVREISKDRKGTTIIVLCGSGNNGGDGLVTARLLYNQGYDVRVFLSSKPDDLKNDARINYNVAVRFGIKVKPMKGFLLHHTPNNPDTIVIDALIGTGLNKEINEPLSDVIKKINKLTCPVISIDIASGISSDNGQIMGCAVKADYTVTFGLPKRGHLLFPGAEHTGRLFIEDIGFPQKLLRSDDIKVNLVGCDDVISMLPERPRYSHKGRYGHVLIIAGSRGKTGAGLMAAKACLKTGAGLVTLGVPESLMDLFQSRVTEEMTLALPDKGNGTLSIKACKEIIEFTRNRVNVLAIGPGLSVDDEIKRVMRSLITRTGLPLVIDADGINAMSGDRDILKKAISPVILTPHPGEMARLLNCGIEDIEKDRINTALSFAEETKTYLVLKGVPTVIATPDGEAYINPTGNPGMAKAGTGDVLTGMISAFLAQGLSPRDSAITGVYLHGLSGDMAKEIKGKYSLTASDIIRIIPSGFKRLIPQ